MKETIKVCCPASYLFDEVLECDVEVVLVLARGQVERAPHPQRHGLAPKQLLGVDLKVQKRSVTWVWMTSIWDLMLQNNISNAWYGWVKSSLNFI